MADSMFTCHPKSLERTPIRHAPECVQGTMPVNHEHIHMNVCPCASFHDVHVAVAVTHYTFTMFFTLQPIPHHQLSLGDLITTKFFLRVQIYSTIPRTHAVSYFFTTSGFGQGNEILCCLSLPDPRARECEFSIVRENNSHAAFMSSVELHFVARA